MTIDDDLIQPVRQSLNELHMRTPVESIIQNGRRRRRIRRRLGATAVTAVAGVATVIVATSIVGSNAPKAGAPAAPASSTPAKLAAFTVTSSGGGTTLSLLKGSNLNPDALRQALAQRGIPALVTVGKFCRTPSASVDTGQIIVPQQQADGTVNLTLNPAAIPSGAELSIGYFPNTIRFLLIDEHAPLTCAADSSQPADQQPGGSQVVHANR